MPEHHCSSELRRRRCCSSSTEVTRMERVQNILTILNDLSTPERAEITKRFFPKLVLVPIRKMISLLVFAFQN